MKKTFLTFLITIVSFFAFSSQKAKKVAVVELMRGDAIALTPAGEKQPLKKGSTITEGSILKTGQRSFLKISFYADQSKMNVGPKSELKIEKYSEKEAGVINVLTGKIRSQVTKDYRDMDKGKSKLYVKSRNAVMGVRGTDFLFSANKKTGATTTVLFEGSIVFNKIHKDDDLRNLEDIVKRGRSIVPGEVSVAMRNLNKPTVPAKLSSGQFNKLNGNKNFEVSDVSNVKKLNSKVPPGLNGIVVAGENEKVADEIKKVFKVDISKKTKEEENTPNMENSKGFVKGDDVKPADGVFVHVDSGTIISPGMDSSFDKNSGEWVSATNGGVNAAGEYVPPTGFKMTEDGDLLKINAETGAITEAVVVEIKPVDQTPVLDNAPTMQYTAPVETNVNDASMNNINVNETMMEFEKPLDEIMKEEEQMLLNDVKLNPDGTVMQTTDNGEVLETMPRPADCSTCEQPDSIFVNTGAAGTTNVNKTRVKVQVNKK